MRPTSSRKIRNFLTLTLLASLALSACGVRGSLKTPPPIWGEKIYDPAQTPTEQTPSEQAPAQTPDNAADNLENTTDSDN